MRVLLFFALHSAESLSVSTLCCRFTPPHAAACVSRGGPIHASEVEWPSLGGGSGPHRMAGRLAAKPAAKLRAAVVGGGPAGLLTAIMLARRGWGRVDVFDARSAPPAASDATWGAGERSYQLGAQARATALSTHTQRTYIYIYIEIYIYIYKYK